MPARRTPTRGAVDRSRDGGAKRRPARPGRRTGRGRSPATPRPRFTHRMAVVVVVAAVLAVSYASSMRAYLQQRADMQRLSDQIAQSEANIKVLEKEQRRWKDKAYVEAQARERFGWVMPGETSYQVIDRDGKPLETSDALGDPDSVRDPLPDPWWQKVYGSLENADHPERVPVPAHRITPPPTHRDSP